MQGRHPFAAITSRASLSLFPAVVCVMTAVNARAQDLPREARDAIRKFGVIRVIAEVRPQRPIPGISAAMSTTELATRTVRPIDLQSTSAIAPGVVTATVTARGYADLVRNENLSRVFIDRLSETFLPESAPLIGAPGAWKQKLKGGGFNVAVLDTGVDGSHPALKDRIVREACFSTEDSQLKSYSFCPDSRPAAEGPGSARPCPPEHAGCDHGTHVAGIVASVESKFQNLPISGIASETGVVAVQVFSLFKNPEVCGSTKPCVRSWTSDQIKALQWVKQLTNSMKIAAVNMSLGGDPSTQACDEDPIKVDIDELRAKGVATVIAAGNSAMPGAISNPACVSTSVSVGASDDRDRIATRFSNRSALLSLVAPGDSIASTVPSNSYAIKAGTSMATPHVAGAWAIAMQVTPGASVTQVLNAFRSSGLQITDPDTGLRYARINVLGAIDVLKKVAVGTAQPPMIAKPVAPSPSADPLQRAIVISNTSNSSATDVMNSMGASAPRGSQTTVERLPGSAPRFSVIAPSSAMDILEKQGFKVNKDRLSTHQ